MTTPLAIATLSSRIREMIEARMSTFGEERSMSQGKANGRPLQALLRSPQ